MLLPQYTIRWLLILTAVCGGFFLMVTSAIEGQIWAAAITIAAAGLLLTLILHALLFAAVWAISLPMERLRADEKASSPFAGDAPPPQIIEPEQTE